MTKKKLYSAEFKAKVALEAIKQQQTINQIATQFSVHPNQVRILMKMNGVSYGMVLPIFWCKVDCGVIKSEHGYNNFAR